MKLPTQLKELIHRNDTTVAQVARATKISSKTIYQWINGQKPRDLDQVKKVADHFEVTIDFLAFGIETTKSNPIAELKDEINAGFFEVILRKTNKP
jgi:transcriptional regulator with XRE-family HTH domain